MLLPLIGGVADDDVPCRLATAWMSFASPIAKHDGSVPILGKMWGLPRLLLDLLSIGVVRMMRRGWSSREDAELVLQEPADCGLGRE